jgi:hypothetical protein
MPFTPFPDSTGESSGGGGGGYTTPPVPIPPHYTSLEDRDRHQRFGAEPGSLPMINKNLPPRYRRFDYSAVLPTIEDVGHHMIQSRNDSIRRYTPGGDTLTVMNLAGMLPVYVQMGSDAAPYIRVREGMVLYGDLSSVRVRTGWAGWSLNPSTQAVRATFYASTGPLIGFPAKGYGMRRGMVCTQLVAPVIGAKVTLYSLLAAQLGIVPGPNSAASVGRYGGTLILKNLEAAGGDTLYLRYETVVLAGGGVLSGFPILPGESLTLQLEEPILGGPGPTFDALVVWGGAGTCDFGLILSSCEFDFGSGELLDDSAPPLG